MTRATAWEFFAVAIAVMMVVALSLILAPSANAQEEVCTNWSDNFNGGAQQTWMYLDGGTNSSFKFQNNRYEMHTEGSADSRTYLASGVNSSGTDYEMQARIQRITTGDNFFAYLLARGDVSLKRGYSLGTSTCGCFLELFKLLPGGASSTLIATTPVTFNPGDFKLKLRVSGASLSGKVWNGGTEPGWQISCTDASYPSGVGGIVLFKPPFFPWTTVQAAFDDVSMTCLNQGSTLITPNPLIGTGSHSSTVSASTTLAPPINNPMILTQSANLSARSVTPGMPVTVTADIVNKSSVNGSKKVTLYINGRVETTQGVTVNSGGSTQLTFNVSRNEPGEYSVYVDGVPAGSFEVELFREFDGILIFSAILVALAFLIGMVTLWRRQRAV